ncbi:MAG: HAD-IA family hydrolase [Planctomycetales bacterium]|nr:HAD-IA family hydrolase [Planctomycetales bacterium]
MAAHDWIVFDSTGTLMTPDPEPAIVYQSTGRRLGSRLTIPQVRDDLKSAMLRHFFGDTANAPTSEQAELLRWRRIVADTLSDLRGEILETAFQSLWHHFASSETWRIYPDVVPTLTRLKSSGYSIAIASNFDGRLRSVMAGSGIQDCVDEVFISSDLGWSKPNTLFYDSAAERLGASDRSRLLMIGDTQRGDVDAARQAGWDARLLVRDRSDALLELTEDLCR